MRHLLPAANLSVVFLVLVFMWPFSANAQRGRGGQGGELWQAAFDGDLEGVKAAVERGGDVNAKGRGGFSALLAAYAMTILR
jgi:hypothetical protein